MIGDRSIGIREAGLGLSLLTGALIVLGYVLLQRLGGTGRSTQVEVVPPGVASVNDSPAGRKSESDRLQILNVQDAESTMQTTPPRTTRLPHAPPLDKRPSNEHGNLELNGLDNLWRPTPTEAIIPAAAAGEMRK